MVEICCPICGVAAEKTSARRRCRSCGKRTLLVVYRRRCGCWPRHFTLGAAAAAKEKQ